MKEVYDTIGNFKEWRQRHSSVKAPFASGIQFHSTTSGFGVGRGECPSTFTPFLSIGRLEAPSNLIDDIANVRSVDLSRTLTAGVGLVSELYVGRVFASYSSGQRPRLFRPAFRSIHRVGGRSRALQVRERYWSGKAAEQQSRPDLIYLFGNLFGDLTVAKEALPTGSMPCSSPDLPV
ncbi:hypothetical protein AgCh_035816 [Apium graveolens]